MEPIKPLHDSLISYQNLMEHLRSKGKGKIWFDTIRTRYKMIHAPIIKPYGKFVASSKKSKHGRRVFYMQAIVPYIDEIIDLHDKEGHTYIEIKKIMKNRTDSLREQRDADINIDVQFDPESLFIDFLIAKAKLGSFYGWGDDSQDMKALNHIYKTRQEDGKRYFELTGELQRLIKEGRNAEAEKKRQARDKVGDSLNYCRAMMMSTIQHCAELVKQEKIDIREEDREEVRSAILKG